MNFEVDIYAVVVAGLAAMVLGFFWYDSFFFGKQWMKLNKFDKKDMYVRHTHIGLDYFLGIFATILSAYVLALVIGVFDWTSLESGAFAGLIVWIGFIAPTMFGKVLWERMPFKLYLIDTGYHLVAFVLMGMVLNAWV
jgi:hypothetical protein